MLWAEDLIRNSGPRDSSGHCSFKSFPNAGKECYRSPGSGRGIICLPCLRYHCYLCKLPLPWKVIEFKAPLKDSSYKLSYPGLAGA